MSHHGLGCDAHKRYSLFAVLDQNGQLCHQARVDHQPGAIRTFLDSFPQDTPVALESVGNSTCLTKSSASIPSGSDRTVLCRRSRRLGLLG